MTTKADDVAEPSAGDGEVDDVNVEALKQRDPTMDVEPSAIRRPDPAPDVDAEALSRPPAPAEPPRSRRHRVMIGVAAVVLVGVAGGGLWWNRQVTADPRLEFSGGLNVYRDAALTDLSGIVRRDGASSFDSDKVDVGFVPNSRLYAMVGLHNGGAHDVRIEAGLSGGMYTWGFDRMSVSTDPDGGYNGQWAPFRPFTLRREETRQVRLEFRLADCDPVAPHPGGYSVLKQLRFRYQVLGISRTADVPFPDETIALQGTGECTSPIDD